MPPKQMKPGSWSLNIVPKQQPNGSFMVRVTYRRHDGETRRQKFYGKTAAACRNAANDALPDLVGDTHSSDVTPDMAYNALAELWIEELHRMGLAASTVHEEERLIRQLIMPRMKSLTVREASPSRHLKLYNDVRRSTPAQADNMLVPLRKIGRHMVMLDLKAQNPAADIKAGKKPMREIIAPDIMELDQLRAHVQAFNARPGRPGPKPSNLLEHVIETILGTSGRISEVLGLRWQDVDLQSTPPTVTFDGTVAEGKGQTKAWRPFGKTEAFRRKVTIPDFLVEILTQRLADSDGNTFVFHTRTGAPNGPQDVHRSLRAVREWAGISETIIPHSLRKSVATIISNGDGGLDAAKSQLGHRYGTPTETTYAKRALRAPDVRSDLNKLAPGGGVGRN